LSLSNHPQAGSVTPPPSVTVSLVTYNGASWLAGCLDSLAEQTFRDFELLVVDNASTDGTLEYLGAEAGRLPGLSVDASPVNLGFAVAQNRNIYRSRSEFVCLLNQDVELDERFLEEALAAFTARPRVGAVQGRLLRLRSNRTRSDTIDTTGLDMYRSRRVVSRGQGRRDGPGWQSAGPVWGVDGPAPVYRRAALLDVQEPRTGGGTEILDEDFFMYKEDVDLAWRLRRRGWRTWYQPSAVGWHARTAGAGDATSLLNVARSNWQIDPWIKAISWRNQRLMQLKNETSSSIRRDFAWLYAREVLSLLFMLLADTGRVRAALSLMKAVPSTWRKRSRTGSRWPR
jgi:GT2 family glycosyltransferase